MVETMQIVFDPVIPFSGPGWTDARFEYASIEGNVEVPGYTRGMFGIFEFVIIDDEGEEFSGASLTHLPTGYRMFAFDDVNTAAKAAELIEHVCDWSALTPDAAPRAEWTAQIQKIIHLWSEHGIHRTGPRVQGRPTFEMVI
jgi:hypothetical protein